MKNLSVPLLRRLPLYHSYVEQLVREDKESVASRAIGEYLNLDAIQVRKDIEQIGVVGRPGIGYDARQLLLKIEEFMGWENPNQMILAGCGSLGSALMGYAGFELRNFEIVAGFDVREDIQGTRIHGINILPLEKMKDLSKRMHIELGIIAVPEANAQEVADIMVESGIKGIWNFSTSAINVPKEVAVQQEDLITSLVILQKNLMKNKEKFLKGDI